VYLKPEPRAAVATLRRLRRTVDVFVNLYDLADSTGQVALCDIPSL
jgi:hypothetical protein